MKVTTIRSTPDPERLVCEYARGDYHDGFIGDTSFVELMDGVDTEPRHRIEAAAGVHDWQSRAALEDNPPTENELGEMILAEARKYYLLEDLIRKGHFGVFEHPQLNLAAKGASRVLMAQITRHRQITFDIQSQRYVDFRSKDDPVKIPATLRNTDGVMNREQGLTELPDEVREGLNDKAVASVQDAVALYNEMVERGVPKEDARFFLPEGTKVNIGFSGNARALMHVMNMRMQADAQWEARELSGMMLDEFQQWMPWTHKMFEKHGPFQLSP